MGLTVKKTWRWVLFPWVDCYKKMRYFNHTRHQTWKRDQNLYILNMLIARKIPPHTHKETIKAWFQVTLLAKMSMPDLQRYPWNLNLIKNVEETLSWWFQVLAGYQIQKCLTSRVAKVLGYIGVWDKCSVTYLSVQRLILVFSNLSKCSVTYLSVRWLI